ncbi:uncharacterized protein LOC124356753 isoform X1 [Homalodisca vitripennis]|uniref:uncharacterized protein LOC124356753 isoform X1 n=1 Tax=Homalodisca vitripennis TaxID=197043 RepID=UPI001EEA1FB9|nr:uncharacterized protein LOC124356753 isoform X1 [Homalodisca vitripennis]
MLLINIVTFVTCVLWNQDLIKADLPPEKLFVEALKCREQSLATRDDLHSIALRVPPETMSGKCTLLCMMTNHGLVENGRYNQDNTYQFLKKHFPERPMMVRDMEETAKNCQYISDKVPEDYQGTCEHAYILAVCIQENLKGVKM